MSRKSKKAAPVVAEVAAVVTPAEEVLRADDLRPDDLQDAVKTSPANEAPTLQELLSEALEDSEEGPQPPTVPPEPSFHADLPLEELPHPELDSTTALGTFPGSFIVDPPNEVEQLYHAETAVDMPSLQPGFGDAPHPPPEFFEALETVELGPPPVGIKPPSPRGYDFMPTVGSWWTMQSADPFALTVAKPPVDGNVMCVDYVMNMKKSDLLGALEARMVFKGVETVPLEDFRTGILTEIPACPQWVIDGRDDSPEPSVGFREISAPSPGSAPLLGVQEVAAELGIDAQQVNLLVDSALGAAARLLTFKSVLSSSPVVERILQVIQSPRAVEGIAAMVSQVLPLVGSERLVAIEEKTEIHRAILFEHGKRIDGIVALHDSLDALVTAIHERHKAAIIELNARVDSVACNLEIEEETIDKLCKQVLPDDEDSETIQAEPGRLYVRELSELKNELIAVINQQLNPIREEMAILSTRQDDVERKRLVVEQQKKKDQRRRFDAMRTPKNEQLEVRRARDKTAREQKKRDAPPPSLSPPPSSGEKRGRGRPKGSTNVQKPPKLVTLEKAQKVKKQPLSKPVKPAPVFVDFVAQIMGDRTDPKIKKMLGQIAPHNLPKFASQLKRGVPDLPKLTDWNDSQRWAFTQWFYSAKPKA